MVYMRDDPGSLGRDAQVRRAAGVCLIALSLGFAALMGAAMVVYPGGSFLDRGAVGHHFFYNFFCDLTQPIALNGSPNPLGSTLAQAGMLVLVAAFVPFWVVLPGLFPGDQRLGAAVRGLGLISVVGLVGVPLTPSGRFGALHTMFVFAAGIPGIVAGVLAAVGLWRAPLLRWIAAVTLLVALVNGALYVHNVVTAGAVPLALPAIQKAAAAGLLCWMVAVGLAVLRGERL
jgi:hypothetical protein